MKKRSDQSGQGFSRLVLVQAPACWLVGNKERRTVGFSLFSTILIVLGTANCVEAQSQQAPQAPGVAPELPDIVQGESVLDRFNRLHRAQGFSLGPFNLQARIDLALGYDTNVFDSKHHVTDDGFVLTGAGGTATALGPDYFVNFDSFLARTTYFTDSSNDVYAGRVTGNGWKDLTPNLRLYANALVGREVEPRDDPQSNPETEPVTYWHYKVGTDLETRNAHITFRGGLAYDRVDYDNVDSTMGSLDLNYRNMNEVDAIGRATYNISLDRQIFLETVGNVRIPDEKHDNVGVDRQSIGFQASIGTDYALTPLLRFLTSVGYRQQFYKDSDVSNPSGPIGNLQLVWNPTVTTDVSAQISHDFYESFDFDSPGYWLSSGRVVVTQQIRRDFVFEASATLGYRNFVSSSQHEQFYDLSASIKWGVAQGLIVSLSNTYEVQTAHGNNEDFNSDTTLLHITKSF